jgi:hypothetical protein
MAHAGTGSKYRLLNGNQESAQSGTLVSASRPDF